MPSPLRCSEWSTIEHGFPAAACREIDAAVEAWRSANHLPSAPLSFGGPGGIQLCTRQYVGVVEIGDSAIEVYPKLDAELLQLSETTPLSSAVSTDSVMSNLLWMLEVGYHFDVVEAGTAHVEEVPTSFFDILAYLLGKNLVSELERGSAHDYLSFEDDLRAVRGRIRLMEQVTRNWSRLDRIRCAWDEFTPDTPINRVLKCACRFLIERVSHREAARLLSNCAALLDEVEDVPPTVALRLAENLRFNRSVERFKVSFDLAKRLLASIGNNLGIGSSNTFVFLLDMNDVFESYVSAALREHFGIVERQKFVGTLFPELEKAGIYQLADYTWREETESWWIGDAKYKHLARGHKTSLRFTEFEQETTNGDSADSPAGRILSAADVRQLTVYGELLRLQHKVQEHPNLMLLYPFVGEAVQMTADRTTAWNGSEFWLMPVQVRRVESLRDAITFRVPEEVKELVTQ